MCVQRCVTSSPLAPYQVRTLQAKVADLQENEEQIVQEAEMFRETLQATVSSHTQG